MGWLAALLIIGLAGVGAAALFRRIRANHTGAPPRRPNSASDRSSADWDADDTTFSWTSDRNTLVRDVAVTVAISHGRSRNEGSDRDDTQNHDSAWRGHGASGSWGEVTDRGEAAETGEGMTADDSSDFGGGDSGDSDSGGGSDD